MQVEHVSVWLESLAERGLIDGPSQRLLAAEVSLLAEQIDRDASNAALWGQYRAARAELQEVISDSDDGTFADLMERLRGSEVVDPPSG